MKEYAFEALAQYDLDSAVVSCERYGHGHINETYLVVTESGCRYILQKINQTVFRDVDALMANIEAVTSWLRRQSADPREVLHPVRSRAGQTYVRGGGGSAWRIYDFGDSIRFGAASAAEDERDLSKMELRLDLFETYTRGFLSACPGLTKLELELLPVGAKLMTLECGIRFLTDYLDGDRYFAIHREGHNLDRCRAQFKLVADMEAKWEQMQKIVKEIAG